MQETQEMHIPSLVWEDSLEKGMATHSSILTWRIPWTEERGRLQSIVLHRVVHDWSDLAHTQSIVKSKDQAHILFTCEFVSTRADTN